MKIINEILYTLGLKTRPHQVRFSEYGKYVLYYIEYKSIHDIVVLDIKDHTKEKAIAIFNKKHGFVNVD